MARATVVVAHQHIELMAGGGSVHTVGWLQATLAGTG